MMTDKQIKKLKQEFFEKFGFQDVKHPTTGLPMGFKEPTNIGEVWQWIERELAEAEKRGIDKGIDECADRFLHIGNYPCDCGFGQICDYCTELENEVRGILTTRPD